MAENKISSEKEEENNDIRFMGIDREEFAKKASNKKDEFLIAGLYGDESYLNYINKLAEEKNEVINRTQRSYDEKKKYERERISSYEKEIKEGEKDLNSLVEKKSIIENTLSKAKGELSKLHSGLLQSIKILISKRQGYRNELLKRKIDVRTGMNSELTSRLVYEEKRKLEYEEKLFNISEQRYKKNEKEYNRRISLFETKRKAVEDKFNKFDVYIDILRKFGVTRTTSGFLIWSSYLGFVAFGWFIGEMIIKKLKPDNSFVSLFANAINELVTTKWMGVLVAILLPLFIILVYISLLHFTKFLQLKFNPYLENGKSKQKKEDTNRSLLDVFFTNTSTDSTNYSTIISKLPMAYFWTIIPLIIAVILPNTIDSGSVVHYTPIDTAVFTYFGIVLCIVFSGFVLVYSLKVIEPRIFTKIIPLIKDAERIKPRMFLKYNIELVVTSAFIVIGFLAISVGEISNSEILFWENNNSIIILLLLLLCSFVLSYGIIYRGIFREHVALKRTLYLYEKEIEKYCVMPVLKVDNTVYNKYANELDSLQKEIDKIWNLEDLWRMPKEISNDFYNNFLNIFKFKNRSALPKQNDDPLRMLINADFVFENELTTDLLSSEEKIRRLGIEIENQESEFKSIGYKKDYCNVKLSELKDKLDAVKEKTIQLDEELNEKINEHREYYSTLNFELKNAYSIGRSFKQKK